MTTAETVLARCTELDTISASPTWLERAHLTPEHARANALAERWLRGAGLTTWQDAAGNICGRREGAEPGLPALLLGSHLDTVPDAGSFDGMLGVTMAIAVAERIDAAVAQGRMPALPFALEVIGFSDEEGARFGKALLGSQAVAGTWDEDWWDLRDRDGTTLHQAFGEFGLDPRRVGEAARRPEELVGYLEAHIEQGPYLEAADASLGYVTTIAGARRFRLSVTGEARHAGGTPYERRRDALLGASEMVVAIERLARAAGTIATVGRLEVQPGAVNVIAGRADLSLDLRAATDAQRDASWVEIEAELQRICTARRLRLDVAQTHEAPAAPCARWLQEAVVEGIVATGDEEPMGLWSRAGHDAMAIAAITDIGMLFVRCHDGISHHPDEGVREIDVARGLDALEHAVLAVAQRWRDGEVPERTDDVGPAVSGTVVPGAAP
ncbi:allantoate amidohydrolase [Nocardioides sp. zg-ZUI104]|uniref:allantoate amidohydrolase n=1 Tax=Nocardioides faecalis TaxID=2803858 RepID=UPI001BCAE815|nr:allantoate amidohydrolase [Nocardioides faecalis]MBS4753651.1 allantoate amidohydrolase [Nocardioides faecalis]